MFAGCHITCFFCGTAYVIYSYIFMMHCIDPCTVTIDYYDHKSSYVPSGVIKHGVLENPRTEWRCRSLGISLISIVHFPARHL